MKTNKSKIFTLSIGILSLTLGLGATSLPPAAATGAGASVKASARGQYDGQIQQAVTKSLQASQFKDVQASVANGVVTLRGTVATVAVKLKAEKTAHKRHVSAVDDEIQVAGKKLSDAEIQKQLGSKLAYDRVGYGVTFNALALKVHNGVATIIGEVRTPVDKDSALALAENQPGVTDVVDQIVVAPVSIMDDQLRLRVARAVYGDPVLNKYAIDPAKPIRIVVDNGHVTLAGTVINRMDKQVAGMRANSVPGVFSVDNRLVVARGEEGSGM